MVNTFRNMRMKVMLIGFMINFEVPCIDDVGDLQVGCRYSSCPELNEIIHLHQKVYIVNFIMIALRPINHILCVHISHTFPSPTTTKIA
jgi:hypothetical protein